MVLGSGEWRVTQEHSLVSWCSSVVRSSSSITLTIVLHQSDQRLAVSQPRVDTCGHRLVDTLKR